MTQSDSTSTVLPEGLELAERAPKRTASDSSDGTIDDGIYDMALSPTKRRCTSPLMSPDISTRTINNANATNTTNNLIQLRSSQLTIHSIVHLPESALWSLCKGDLRTCFLALQSYARSPYPLNSLTAPSHSILNDGPVPPPPSFLRLPLEIRQYIYSLTLPPQATQPIKGPHPRQLQNTLQFTQPIPAQLLLLNHQIRLEALPLLYGASTQTAHVTIDYNLWAHKTKRSVLVLSNLIPSSLRHIHITLSLGTEKRPLVSPSASTSSSSSSSPNSIGTPHESEASTRLLEIKKGIRKLLKWLGGADIRTLVVSWQEPPQTYSWMQKMEVLEGLRGMRAVKVREGVINWGLEMKGKWNRGRRFKWEEGWITNLERGRGG